MKKWLKQVACAHPHQHRTLIPAPRVTYPCGAYEDAWYVQYYCCTCTAISYLEIFGEKARLPIDRSTDNHD